MRILRINNRLVIAVLIAITCISISCSGHKENKTGDNISDRIPKIEPVVVSSDSLSPPAKVYIKNPSVTKISDRLDPVRGKSNVSELKTARQIILKEPLVKQPGTAGVSLPVQTKVIERGILCGSPEIITVKPPSFRDENPANFCSYNKIQGLKHDQVRGMDQDSAGSLWLATDDGLISYDGRYFSRYSTDQGLTGNLILTVCIDQKDNVWAGTYLGGLIKYDGKYIFKYSSADGLAGDNVNIIYSDPSGLIWIGTSTGLTSYDGNSFISYTVDQGLCNNDVRTLITDEKGQLWIGTYGGGISVFDGKRFRNYSTNEGLVQNYISSIFIDRAGNIWIASSGRGIMKSSGDLWLLYGKEEGLESESFSTIEEDADGNIWLGSLDNGLIKIEGSRVSAYTEKEGLSSNIIRCALSDRNGYLWFGTRGGGFVKYNGNLFSHFTVAEGLSDNRVMTILEDHRGDLWLGTFSGFVTRLTFNEKNGIVTPGLSYLGAKDGILNNRIYSIEEDKKGNIWIATDGGGVSKFDGKSVTTYTTRDGLCSSYLRDIFIDREGAVWIASYGYGVSRIAGDSIMNYSVQQGLSSGTIMSIFQDSSDNFWFGTADNGLCRYNGKEYIHYTPENGFPGITVYSIMQDKDGNMWFGTGGAGVVIYDGKEFRNITFEGNTDYSHILGIYQDSKNNVWLGTRFGPIVISQSQADAFLKSSEPASYTVYSFEDGFTGIGLNLQAIEESADGTIWMGTTDRLTAFHPGGEPSEIARPALRITGIQLYNEDLKWTQLLNKPDTTFILHNGVEVGKLRFGDVIDWSGQPKDLSLKYDNNYLTINYIAIALAGNDKIRYQYMLEGLEENWNIPTSRTDVSYGNLSPGKYNFRLRATDRAGGFSGELQYHFSIRPPWWRTIWFYILAVSIAVLLVLGYIRLREKKLREDGERLRAKVEEQTSEILKKNRELTRINAEKDKLFSIIAHDLRSPFNVFLGFTQYISEGLKQMSTDEIAELTEKMKTSAENLFSLLENLLEWSRIQRGQIIFNPAVHNVFDLTSECITVLREQAALKSIEIRIKIPSGLTLYGDKNMLQVVIRNLVSNAIKFTPREGYIDISARGTEGGRIEFSIRDSGIGMDEKLLKNLFSIDSEKKRKGTEGEISTGLGLILCREFIEKHNGTIRAESQEGKGSVFYFLV